MLSCALLARKALSTAEARCGTEHEGAQVASFLLSTWPVMRHSQPETDWGPDMFGVAKFDVPEGLPVVDTVRSRQIVQLGSSGLPVLNALRTEERDALFTSLAIIVRTADYHTKRFNGLLAAVNERRKTANALITYDFTVEYAVFEAAAALSAIRSAVDEIIFIAARLAGIAGKDIKQNWKTSNVMTAGFDSAPHFNLPEVNALRVRLKWYDDLNDYRNAYRHRGCRDTVAAYFPLDSDYPEAKDGDRNVMLLPDRSSLVGNTRADQWAYSKGVRLETLLETTVKIFEELLDELIGKVWGGAAYLAQEWIGKIPAGEYNMILLHARPALHVIGQNVLLPLFSTRDLAHNFIKDTTGADKLHLAELTPNEVGLFGLDVSGYKDAPEFAKLTGKILVCLDPVGFRETGGKAVGKVRAHQESPLGPFLAEYDAKLLGIPRAGVKDAERLFVWRVPNFV